MKNPITYTQTVVEELKASITVNTREKVISKETKR